MRSGTSAIETPRLCKKPHGRRFGTPLLFRVIFLLKRPQQLSRPDLRAGSPFRPKTKDAAVPLSLFRLTPSLGWQEITRALFLFHNPWDCPVWTASLGLEGPSFAFLESHRPESYPDFAPRWCAPSELPPSSAGCAALSAAETQLAISLYLP